MGPRCVPEVRAYLTTDEDEPAEPFVYCAGVHST
jgi:hypothetical protein